MSDSLKIEITPEDFDKIQDSPGQSAIDKKLGIIFKVISPMQSDISTLKNHAEKRVNICAQTVQRLEGNIKDASTPKLNPVKVAGVGGGGITIGAIFAKGPEIIKALSDWFHK